MIQSVYRVTSTGFVDLTGKVLFEAVAGSDGHFYDEHGRRCTAVVISATGGAVRCTLSAGRGGEGGGYQITRKFDVAPQFDAIFSLNFKSMKVEVDTLFDSDTVLSYAVVYDHTSRMPPPLLRRYERCTGAVSATVPEGAVEFVPDAADTWTWGIQTAGGLTMTQVFAGAALEPYPVLGQTFTPTVDNTVLWMVSQP